MHARRRPTICESFRLGYDVMPKWFLDAIQANNITNINAFLESVNETVKIKTLEGVMNANKGDFIIRGIKGEIYPCKADVYRLTYDPINLKHIEVGDELAEKTLFLDEAHYLGEDAGDIITFDENHKIVSEANEEGLITIIYLYAKDGEQVTKTTLYENGQRVLSNIVIPETFSAAVESIDDTKTAYEFLRIERVED